MPRYKRTQKKDDREERESLHDQPQHPNQGHLRQVQIVPQLWRVVRKEIRAWRRLDAVDHIVECKRE